MKQEFIQNVENFLTRQFALGETPGEYALLRNLEDLGHFDDLDTRSPQLRLFQKNFLCMHALYHIQARWIAAGWHLSISPLKISREKLGQQSKNKLPGSADTQLAEYYLNWDNYTEADEKSVARLQSQFYKLFQAWLNAESAYGVLGVDIDADWSVINKRYRKLVQTAHPDKGGDSDTFQSIQAAYEQLRVKFRTS